MSRRTATSRLRDRLVLGQLRPLLADGEHVVAWSHVETPDDRRHGVLVLTPSRAVIRWTPRDLPDGVVPWDEVAGWRVESTGRRGPVLTLETDAGPVRVCLPVTSRGRARRTSLLLRRLVEHAPAARRNGGLALGARVELPSARRGWWGHTRRVVVTVTGVAVILFGLLFASPFVPGPGTLTILAGLALLASEYDWARDVHHWFRHRMERLWAWWQARRRRHRADDAAHTGDA